MANASQSPGERVLLAQTLDCTQCLVTDIIVCFTDKPIRKTLLPSRQTPLMGLQSDISWPGPMHKSQLGIAEIINTIRVIK